MNTLTSLICGCVNQDVLESIDLKSISFGQITRIGIFKTKNADGTHVEIPRASLTDLAELELLQASINQTKLVISPILHNPTPNTGSEVTYGSGNSVNGGIPILVSRQPSTLDLEILNAHPETAAAFGKVNCSGVGVVIWDRCGNAMASSATDAANARPIPLNYLFVSSLEFGGLESPNKNMVKLAYKELNWSENAIVIEKNDFNPVQDLLS
jgi:hypothetical protein